MIITSSRPAACVLLWTLIPGLDCRTLRSSIEEDKRREGRLLSSEQQFVCITHPETHLCPTFTVPTGSSTPVEHIVMQGPQHFPNYTHGTSKNTQLFHNLWSTELKISFLRVSWSCDRKQSLHLKILCQFTEKNKRTNVK